MWNFHETLISIFKLVPVLQIFHYVHWILYKSHFQLLECKTWPNNFHILRNIIGTFMEFCEIYNFAQLLYVFNIWMDTQIVLYFLLKKKWSSNLLGVLFKVLRTTNAIWGKCSIQRPIPNEQPPNFNSALHFQGGASSVEQPYAWTHIVNSNVCVGVIRDDTPLWKCKTGLKLGGRSPGTGRSLKFFLYRFYFVTCKNSCPLQFAHTKIYMPFVYLRNSSKLFLLQRDHENWPLWPERVGDMISPPDFRQALPSPSWTIPKLRKEKG